MELDRAALEAIFPEVLDEKETQVEYLIIKSSAPLATVKRRSDGKRGTLTFKDDPRLYFNFTEDKGNGISY